MSLLFDGVNDYVIRTASGLTNGDNISITCWFRPTVLDAARTIVQFYEGTAGAGGYEVIMLAGNTVQFGLRNAASSDPYVNTSQTMSSATTWYPIVITWEITPSNLLKIYMNATTAGTLDRAVSGYTTGGIVDINEIMVGGWRPTGGDPAPGAFSNMALDNAGFWNRVLTSTEINNFITNKHSCYKIAQDFGVGHGLVFCPIALCEGASAPMVPAGTDSASTIVGGPFTVAGPSGIVYPAVATELASAAAIRVTMAGTLTSSGRLLNVELSYADAPAQVTNARWHTTAANNRTTRDEGLISTNASGIGSVVLSNETGAVGSPIMFFVDTSDGTLGQSPTAKHWCGPVLIAAG